jgi:hypothetical protein
MGYLNARARIACAGDTVVMSNFLRIKSKARFGVCLGALDTYSLECWVVFVPRFRPMTLGRVPEPFPILIGYSGSDGTASANVGTAGPLHGFGQNIRSCPHGKLFIKPARKIVRE